MRDGFVSFAAVSPRVEVANPHMNLEFCLKSAEKACKDGAQIVLFPELCLSGYSCQDLFLQSQLICACAEALQTFAQKTARYQAIFVLGLPVRLASKLYNCAAVVSRGKILGLVPKTSLPNYNEFYELRHFVSGSSGFTKLVPEGFSEPLVFGTSQLFSCSEQPNLVFGVEICEDLWTACPPSIAHARAGATLILNLSASNELVGKAEYRRSLVLGQSARLLCGYLYASAGWTESTQDLVFGGHNLAAENGRLLAENEPLSDVGSELDPFEAAPAIQSEFDVDFLASERQRLTSFSTFSSPEEAGYYRHNFSLLDELDGTQASAEPTLLPKLALKRSIDPEPFVPKDASQRAQRCRLILSIQAHGLAKRLSHLSGDKLVLGVSGGLDSTLALLVCARALELLKLKPEGICACTLPGFGTTSRTFNNAKKLIAALGASYQEISIVPAVRQHLSDLGHPESLQDIVYENAQARERTQILMDLANQKRALLVGTGDLSELALGWATYNADHMSMYGVNASVPKTLVRYVIEYVAQSQQQTNPELSRVLFDILDTPVSPELLLPTQDGTIAQKTEELVGPYELHDFFLYQVLRAAFPPKKVFRLAELAFEKKYSSQEIFSWLYIFYRRFFSQQFKRSCLPDGPKVGSVALSPRGDLRMPSDASSALWLAELDELKGELGFEV